jgi:hypothetical protein
MEKKTKNDWNIDRKRFSVSELIDIIESINLGDEIKFQFSGEDYDVLKSHVERFAGSKAGCKYQVSRIIDVINQGDKLNQSYTVIVRRLK